MYQQVSDDVGVQKHYERLMRISNGNHDYALRIATQSVGVPMPLNTNDQFWRGLTDDGFGKDEQSRRFARAKAKRAGVDTTGKVFRPELCPLKEPFSPKAWVSDREEVKAKCKAYGWGLKGQGLYNPPPEIQYEEKPYRIADDIVERETQDVIEAEGFDDLTPRERTDLKEKVHDALMPSGGKP